MANIIDALIVTLGLDPTMYDQGVNHAEKSLDGLKEHVNKTTREIEEGGLKELGEHIIGFAEKAAAVLGVAFGFNELRNAIMETAQEYTDLVKLAQQFHSTSEEIETFVNAGKLLGMSNEQTIGGLKALDRAVQDTAMGLGRAQKIFEEIGINVKDAAGNVKPTTEVMQELAGKLHGMERGKQIRIMERLGLDPALLKLFNADLGALQERMEEIDKATGFNLEKATKNSQAFMKSFKALGLEINTIKMYFEKLFQTAYVEVMPIFADMMDEAKEHVAEFLEFMEEHKPFVVGVIMAIAFAITAFVIPSLIEAAVATWAVVAPFLAIGLAIAAVIAVFALLYDDWQTWMDGGESQLGTLWQAFADVWGRIRGFVMQVFGELKEIAGDTFGVIMSAIHFLVALFGGSSEDIASSWQDLCGKLVTLFEHVGELVFEIIEKIVTVVIPFLWEGIKAGFSLMIDYLRDRFATILGALDDLIPGVMAVFRDMIDGIGSMFSILGDLWDIVIGFITGDFSRVWDGFVSLFSDLGSLISDWWDIVKRVGTAAWEGIVSAATALFNAWVASMRAGWSALWDGLKGVAQGILDWIFGKIDAVIGAFKSVGSMLGLSKPSEPKQPGAATPDDTQAQARDAQPSAAYIAPTAEAANNARSAAQGNSPTQALQPSVVSNSEQSQTTVTKATHIGEINIHTQATDAHAIAASIKPAVESSSMADQADAGML